MITVMHLDWSKLERMQLFEVTMLANASEVRKCYQAGMYTCVAHVDTDNLDNAFAMTNHIDRSWMTNKGVDPKVEQARSTSIGDVLIDSNGDCWVVARFGFDKIDLL